MPGLNLRELHALPPPSLAARALCALGQAITDFWQRECAGRENGNARMVPKLKLCVKRLVDEVKCGSSQDYAGMCRKEGTKQSYSFTPLDLLLQLYRSAAGRGTIRVVLPYSPGTVIKCDLI